MIFARSIIFATTICTAAAFSTNANTVSSKSLLRGGLSPCPENAWVLVDGEDRTLTTTFVGASQEYCEYLLGRESNPTYRGFVKRSGSSFREQDMQELVKGGQEVKFAGKHRRVYWLILPYKRDRFKRLQDTECWRRANGTLVNIPRPNHNQLHTCKKFMNNQIYDLIIKVFPELGIRADLFTGRKLEGDFAMRDFDFDTIEFSDDLKFIKVVDDRKVHRSWARRSGSMKSFETRFRDGWMRPRLENHSQFPIVDNSYHLGVCRS